MQGEGRTFPTLCSLQKCTSKLFGEMVVFADLKGKKSKLQSARILPRRSLQDFCTNRRTGAAWRQAQELRRLPCLCLANSKGPFSSRSFESGAVVSAKFIKRGSPSLRMVEAHGSSAFQAPRSPQFVGPHALIRRIQFSSAESIAEICGKGSCRHRGNQAIMPSSVKQPHSASLDMPLQLLPSNAFRLTKYSDEDKKITLNQHPTRRKNELPLVRNVSASALHCIQAYHKVICFRQEKVDVQENHCLLQCLHYLYTENAYC